MNNYSNSSTFLYQLPRQSAKQNKTKVKSTMSSELDIMSRLDSVDLSKVETSYPILAAGVVSAQVVSVEPVTGDGDEKPYVKVGYTTTEPWQTQPIDGAPSKPVNPGFPLTERVYINDWTDPKSGEVKNFGITRLAQLREAVLGRKATQGEKLSDFSVLLGQPVLLKLEFDPAPKNKKTGQTYGPQTNVASYVRRKS